jgi:Tfp pilus assembly protein PilV
MIRMKGFSFKDESGLTLVEILVAVALILVGLVAVMQAFPLATQGTDTGRRQSTANFLAEQKIEEIKAWALAPSPRGFDNVPTCNPSCTGLSGALAVFNLEGFNSISGYGDYGRTVVVQNGPAANTKLVRVTASYRQVNGGTQVSVETLIAKR